MRKVIIATMTLFGLFSGIFASSEQSVELIIPKPYAPEKGFFATATSMFLVDTIGEFKSIENSVRKKLEPYEIALSKYYTKNELDTLITETMEVVNNKIIKDDMTDARAIATGRYIGKELVGKMFERVLEVEGIKDEKARKVWKDKLLKPFERCMNQSRNFLYDGAGCIGSLTAALIPNVGLAMTYEMSKSKLSPILPEDQRNSFIEGRVRDYRLCFMNDRKKDAEAVKGCALDSIKVGVMAVTKKKVSDTIDATTSDPKIYNDIMSKSMPPFQKCMGEIGKGLPRNKPYDYQINRCLDGVVSIVGQGLIPVKIGENPAVTNNLTSAQISLLVPQKKEEFKKCIDEMVKKDQRVGGSIDSKECEMRITNDVTKSVVLSIFDSNARKNLGPINKGLADSVAKKATDLLEGCWHQKIAGDEKNKCLKDSISTLSIDIANEKIRKELPKENEQTTKIRANLMSGFEGCLNKGLSGDIATDPNLSSKVTGCATELTKNSAMKIAEYQLSEIIGDKVSGPEKVQIINKHVYRDLEHCLGSAPSEEILASCVTNLKKNASRDIAILSFSAEIDKFIKENGGKDRLGIKTSDIQKLKSQLERDLASCLEKINDKDPMPQINQCIKGQVFNLATTLGDYQFNASVGSLYKGRESVQHIFHEEFTGNFKGCLNRAQGEDYDLNGYMDNLKTCTNEVSSKTMYSMGRDQIQFALTQNLKDKPGVDRKQQREALTISLLAPYKECLDTAPKKDVCIAGLKTEATKAVVEQYAKNEVEFQLNTKEMPKNLGAILEEFKKCMVLAKSDQKAQDRCVKNFSIKFASALGNIKVQSVLNSTLGTDDFAANKKEIDSMLKDYDYCLRRLNSKEYVNEVTAGVTQCIGVLQKSAEGIVKKVATGWISTTSPFADFNKAIAASLPCIAGLMPASVYDGDLKKQVDSALKPVAIMIGQYLDYNIKEAGEDLPKVLETLLKDIGEGDSLEARRNLVDTLVETGALDQIIKAIVLDKVKGGLKSVSDHEIPQSVKDKISSKANLDSIFKGKVAAEIREMVAESVLRPVLVDGEKMSGQKVSGATKEITQKVTEALATSEKFGQEIIRVSVQNKINQMGSVKRFFGKMIYGSDSFNWSKVRESDKGKIAEAYITRHVLMPKLRGEVIDESTMANINKKAEELVTSAVKSYE